MAGNSIDSGRSVTDKTTSILMAFTEGSEHSLTEIAHLAALPVSTAHRLTAELVSCRLLIRTAGGRYRTGPPLRGMGAAEVRPPNLRERAPCVLEDLTAATGYRARLGVLQELQVAYIEKQPGPRPTSTFLSAATLPAHATALGRVLLAFAPPGMIELTITRGLRAYTQHTITSPALNRPGVGAGSNRQGDRSCVCTTEVRFGDSAARGSDVRRPGARWGVQAGRSSQGRGVARRQPGDPAELDRVGGEGRPAGRAVGAVTGR